MKPDWENRKFGIRLFRGDGFKIVPRLEGIQAIVADPPYGIGYVHGKEKNGPLRRNNAAAPTIFAKVKVVGDDKPFDPSPWLGYERVVLWGANNYIDKLPFPGGWLVWDKREGRGMNDQSDCEMAWVNKEKMACRLFHHMWNGMCRASEKGVPRVHPTQKPIALMEWAMKLVQLEAGTVVCDPYMGSGTTGVACVRMGLPFVGVEIEQDYFDIAVRRIRAAIASANEGFAAHHALLKRVVSCKIDSGFSDGGFHQHRRLRTAHLGKRQRRTK
jgi:site-specific DNA-methyltransferase (adenine-specific)/modification methylase